MTDAAATKFAQLLNVFDDKLEEIDNLIANSTVMAITGGIKLDAAQPFLKGFHEKLHHARCDLLEAALETVHAAGEIEPDTYVDTMTRIAQARMA